MRNYLILFFCCVSLFSCAPSRYVVPLQRKEHALSVNLGGPLIRFSGAVIPVPLTSINYGYGWKRNTTLFASLHTTSLAYGVVQLEMGLVKRLAYWEKRKIGITAAPAFNFMFDKWEYRFKTYPQLDINAYWHFKGEASKHCDCPGDKDTKAFLYVGITNWFELATTRANGEPQPHNLVFAPQIGITASKKSMKYNLEIKYISPFVRNDNTVVSYYNPVANTGAIGVYLSVYKTFMGR